MCLWSMVTRFDNSQHGSQGIRTQRTHVNDRKDDRQGIVKIIKKKDCKMRQKVYRKGDRK